MKVGIVGIMKRVAGNFVKVGWIIRRIVAIRFLYSNKIRNINDFLLFQT